MNIPENLGKTLNSSNEAWPRAEQVWPTGGHWERRSRVAKFWGLVLSLRPQELL